MNDISRYVLDNFKVRKSAAQKRAFAQWISERLEAMGYPVHIEPSGTGLSRNIVVGNPDKADLLLTAHYDTPAVLPFSNFITPENLLVFALYQLFIIVIMLAALIAVSLAVLIFTDNAILFMLAYWGALIMIVWLMLAGKANKNNYNDNTSGVVTLLETAAALPESLRHKVAFVFFDNEEKMMLGSMAFKKRHRSAAAETLLINFDCVADGDHIRLKPPKAVKKDARFLQLLEQAFTSQRGKEVVVSKGRMLFPSDHAVFKKGVGVGAFRKIRVIGLYLGRIHTARDTRFDEENIAVLSSAAVRMIEIL